MKILGISSVTRDCGVALVENGATLGHLLLAEGRGLSETLVPAIRTLLESTGSTLETLDGIAVTAGPGSFTGIKVGLAAAKGLAFTLPCKAAGISTLEALAWSAGNRAHPVYPVMNAGRGEIFAGRYRHSGSSLEQIMYDGLFSPQDLAAIVTGPAFLVGDAAPLVYELLISRRREAEILLLPVGDGLPLAVAVAQVGMMRMASGTALTAASLSPLYIRRAEAEVQLERKQAVAVNRSCSA